MRIALLAPLVSPIAPPFLGGAQALLYDLASGLARRGHTVTLYAADGSHAPGVTVVHTGIDSTRLAAQRVRLAGTSGHGAMLASPTADRDATPMARAFAHLYALIAERAAEHDLLHAHAYDWAAFAYGERARLPVVHTLHLPNLDPDIAALLARLAPALKPDASAARLAAVSHACAATYAPTIRIDAVLYNGLDLAPIPFGAHPAPERYLLFAGRVSPEKGAADAIAIAERAGRPLLIAGGVYDETYYAERVAPHLGRDDARVTFLGALSRERLWAVMAGAEAVLCPSIWDEPFGLVPCEAQAAGTPVIAYARGGLREVISDGVTGWLVPPGDMDAAAAVDRLAALDRHSCRAWVAERFGLDAMLDAHERFYAETLEPSRAATQRKFQEPPQE